MSDSDAGAGAGEGKGEGEGTGGIAEPSHDAELDARGLLCPLPVLKARKRLGPLAPGAVLRILADDPAARVDVPHFCREQGHELLHQRDGAGAEILFWVRKRPG